MIDLTAKKQMPESKLLKIPSDTELLILRHLWRNGEACAREVHDGIAGKKKGGLSSTRKTLDRMRVKALVAIHQRHGVKIFSPTQPKLVTLAGCIKKFQTEILCDEITWSMPMLSQSGSLEPFEIEQLLTMLLGEQATPPV